MTDKEISALLEASPLLNSCKLDPSAVTVRSCQCGQIIRDSSEGRSCVGLVASGSVDVYSIALDGRDIQLNTLKAGDCFGICNLLLSEEMETVLCCRKETVLLFIPKAVLISAMEHDAAFAMKYAAYCNQKIQFLIRRIELLTMQSSRGKVIEYLLSQKDENNRISPDCSREDLARRIGISRAALFRELALLSGQGLVAQEGGSFIIRNHAGLEDILFQSS